MKRVVAVGLAVVLSTAASSLGQQPPSRGGMRVILLGTQGGPTFNAQRIGIGTLVLAGDERLLFDAGRAITTGMSRAEVNPADVTRVFVTHLHSDHVISLPEMMISPGRRRAGKCRWRCGGPKEPAP